jgi:AraC-like DNA-binding protein
MYKRLLPPASLKEYVQYFWCGELQLKSGEMFTHYSAASSKAQLLFHYCGDFKIRSASGNIENTFTAGLYGQKALYNQYWTYSKESGIFGVQLYPHALAALFSIPASELTNQIVALDELLGSHSLKLTEKVNTCHSFEEKVNIVSDFLISRISTQKSKYKNIELAILQMHHHTGQLTLSDLVSHSCLSQRQFERSFKELAGFSPQFYSKLIRFERALYTISDLEKNFTQLSIELGYYDQAHFNRDFKQFTGLSPSQYIAFGYHL